MSGRPTPWWRRVVRGAELGYVSKWAAIATFLGACGGVAAVLFEGLIHVLSHGLREWTGIRGAGLDGIGANAVWVVLVPALGGLVTGLLITRLAPEAEGHGTDSVIKAFHRMGGAVRKRVILLKPLTAAITIGSGGSAGQEGPVAQLGAGVGSTLAKAFKLGPRDRRTLLLAGSTAGIGAMFCSPMGAALFMPEVLYKKPEFEGQAIIPCVIASIVAYATFTTITGRERAIELDPELLAELTFGDTRELLIYLVLGILCTFVGWAYTRAFYGLRDVFQKLRVPGLLKPAIGGALVGGLGLLVALFSTEGVFYGGYDLIRCSIEQPLPARLLLFLMVAKIAATCFSISSGGSGGVFAPSLAIGALLGAAVGQGVQVLFPEWEVSSASFALVGMGGFFAGVSKTPVASVVMVCEMTGGYGLLAPLLLVSVVHMMLAGRWSLYEAQVPGLIDSEAHAGEFVIDVLEKMKVQDVLEEDRPPHLVHEFTTLRQVLHAVADSRESYFPVVDKDEHLIGIFSLTDLRRIYLEDIVTDIVIARDFMVERVVTARASDNLQLVLSRMNEAHINAIPIVADEDERRVVAMLHRNEIGRAYDRELHALRHREGLPDSHGPAPPSGAPRA